MNHYKMNTRSVIAAAIAYILLQGCALHKNTTKGKAPMQNEKVAEFRKGPLKYEVFQMPESKDPSRKNQKTSALKLSLRIINMEHSTSPLRAISKNIDEYNRNNEYLLNEAKNDFLLQINNECLYPKYYAYENNYNAFPFETLNVGYTLDHRQAKSEARLIFIDRMFSSDSIFFNLTLNRKH